MDILLVCSPNSTSRPVLADEALADEVWALWDAGAVTDDSAAWAWVFMTVRVTPNIVV